MSYFWPLLPFPATPGAIPASAPAPTDDSYEIIRKHFNAALDGPNWQALIKAMADADELVWQLAQNAFKQLFLSTASGKYLRRKAADSGIQEYPGLGMSDDKFRDLAIKLSTGRVTYISILEILESYYGSEALRAYADTQAGPFALVDGQTLVFKLEGIEYVYEVNADEFEFVGAAHPTELAVSLTNFFERKGGTARAVVRTDPTTGTDFVRVFSGALGLRSNLAVIGGTAQPYIGFDTYKNVYTGTVTGADTYSWVYSLTSTSKTQLQFTHTVNSVIPKIDTATVKAGDYVVIGPDTITSGWYRVESSVFEWIAGPLYRQTIVLSENIGYTGSITQQSNFSYRFYTPTAHLVSNGNRTVVVSQSVPNVLDVRVPATASVDRTTATAAYILCNTPVEITSVERKNGVVTVQTSTDHGLTANRQVEIAGFVPAFGRSWVTPAGAANLGGSFVHALARTGNISGTVTDIAASSPAVEKLSNGDIVVAGGYDAASAAYARTFKVSTVSTVLANSSQANEARDTTYVISVLGNLAAARWDVGHSLLSGPMVDQLLVTGGNNGGLLSSVEKLTGATWTTQTSMVSVRALHGQVTLDNGNVLVSGGMSSQLQSTASCELYQPLLDSWIPAASMNRARHGHKLHKLSDGRVLAIGGWSMGQQTDENLPGIVGHWRFDEVAGGLTPEVNGLFDLTTAGTPFGSGKVNGAIVMAGAVGEEASYVPDATLRDTFAMTNNIGMSIDFWVIGFGLGNQALVFYSNGVAATGDDNAIFALYEGAADQLEFSYQHGNLITEGPITTPVALGNMSGWHHIAVTGTIYDTDVDFRLYVDGIYQENMFFPRPGGGTDSFLSIGGDPTGTQGVWNGDFDDLRLWNRVLSPTEIKEQYLQGAGYSDFGTLDSAQHTKRALNTVEVYDPVANTWEFVESMGSNRSLFELVELDNEDIVVMGGTGYPQSPRMPLDVGGFWPNENLATVEIYTPSTGKWRSGPSMPAARSQFWSAKVDGRIYTGGKLTGKLWTGVAFEDPTDLDTYWLDTTNFKWSTLPAVSSQPKTWAIGTDTDVVALGGFAGSDALRRFDFIVGDGPTGASGGINGSHKIASIISGTAFTIATEETAYTSNLGFDEQLVPSGSTFAFTNPKAASRTTNVTTVTVSVPEGTLAVFINSNDANFSSGLKAVTGWTSTTITYAEVAANNTGTVYVSAPFTVDSTLVGASAAGEGGIFVIDPTRWTQLSGESASTVALTSGNAYSVVNVTSTASFPDGNGYVVLGLGTELESKPLKYLEVISATELLMAGFTAEQNWPAGTTVTEISLEVTNDIANAAWITGALAAQLAAERDVRESVANDIDLNWSVIYPGDRGLGGEGAANSDAPTVWGPDAFDSGF